MSTITELREVRDRFLELVLSDPDLLDIEFARVLASWNAPPRDAPPKTAQRADRGPQRHRGIKPDDLQVEAVRPHGNAWQLTAARSPPQPQPKE